MKLSKELREGPNQCELIIAITHCRLPNDLALAKAVGAVAHSDPNSHGVDLILGGHDHVYYVGRGVDKFEGSEFDRDMPGSEADSSALLVKSGTDFHDLSEISLTLSAPHPEGAVRRRTIEEVKGMYSCLTAVRRHETSPDEQPLPELEKHLHDILGRVDQMTKQPVAFTLNEWDVRSQCIRTDESGFADFVADVLLISMERTLRSRQHCKSVSQLPSDYRMADCCLICGGSLRSDSVFGPGKITVGNLLEIMPFEDTVIVKELTGQDIWDALENGFSMYPKQEGRFPHVAGMQVVWDSSREPGHRVVSVHVLDQPFDGEPIESNDMFVRIRNSFSYAPDHESNNESSVFVRRNAPRIKEELKLDKKYSVVTRSYMADGNDGYVALSRGRDILDDEAGELMSTLVRKFLLGATYIWRWNRLQGNASEPGAKNEPRSAEPNERDAVPERPPKRRRQSMLEHLFPSKSNEGHSHLSSGTGRAIQRAMNLRLRRSQSVQSMPKEAQASSDKALPEDEKPVVVDVSPAAIRDALFVAGHEHHSHFDSASRIDTSLVLDADIRNEDLAVVVALPDGRMRDQARSQNE